ncbi:MBL fold metallo-hydrolase [Bradyrhizobium sp. Arg314]
MPASMTTPLNIKSHSDQQPWTRFQLGDMSITVVSDGKLALGNPHNWFSGLKDGEIEAALRENFLNETDVSLAQNIMLADTGGRRIIFDVGTGGAPLIGPSAGHLLTNLESAGINAATIDDVILTHGHPDHILGLVNSSNKPVFPNAQVHISEIDYQMVSSEPNDSDPFAAEMNRQISAVRDRISIISDGKQILPGVTALAAPGHTMGHMVFILDSAGKTLLNAADLGHHHAVFTKHPEVNFVSDMDPALMVQTRKRFYDMIAADRLGFMGYHFPFPGIGHLARAEVGYAYVPASLDTI